MSDDLVKLLAEMERKALRKTEFAAMLAVHCNGGDWNTDYTEDQRSIWRNRAERLRKDPSAIEPAPVSVREAARVLLDAARIEPVHDAIQRSVRPAAFCAALRAIAEGKDDD